MASQFDIRLIRTRDGLQITQADGSHIDFARAQGNVALARQPGFGRLQFKDGRWQWQWPGGNYLLFDSVGLLLGLSIDGQMQSLRRFSRASVFANQIREVEDEQNRHLIFHYRRLTTGAIRLLAVDTPQGRVRYTYDWPAGRLTSVASAEGKRTAFFYEPAYQSAGADTGQDEVEVQADVHKKHQNDHYWQLTGIAAAPIPEGSQGDDLPDHESQVHEFQDNGFHNIDSQHRNLLSAWPEQIAARQFDSLPINLQTMSALLGWSGLEPGLFRLRTWQYDSAGRVIRAVLHDQPPEQGTQYFSYISAPATGRAGITEVKDADGQTTRFRWRRRHGRDLLESVTGHGCLGCPAPGLSAAYDTQGRMTAINGLIIRRRPDGSPAFLYQPKGFWPDLGLFYDNRGLLTAWESTLTGRQYIKYDEWGRPTVQGFANGSQWEYTYDGHGRLTNQRETAPLFFGTDTRQPAGHAIRGKVGTRKVTSRKAITHDCINRSLISPHALSRDVITHLRYAPDGSVSLEHPNETTRHHNNPVTSMRTVEVQRPITQENPIPVHYQDVLIGNAGGQGITHLLPEGGSLQYRYSPEGRLLSITWEDISRHRHPVVSMTGPNDLAFGNQVVARRRYLQWPQSQSHSDRQRQQQLSQQWQRQQASGHLQLNVSDASGRLILSQLRSVAPDGRVLSEVFAFPGQARAVRRDFLYTRHQRMAGWVQQRYHSQHTQSEPVLLSTESQRANPASMSMSSGFPEQGRRQHVWFAWDTTGTAVARHDAGETTKSRIQRDASGLPLSVGQWQTRYGPGHQLQAVYRQGMRIQRNLHNALGQRIARLDRTNYMQFYYQDNQLAGEWAIPACAPLRVPRNGAISRRYIYAGNVPVAFIDYAFPASFAERHPPDFSHAMPSRGSPDFVAALRRRLDSRYAGRLYFIHTDSQGLPLAVTDAETLLVWLAEPEPGGQLRSLIAKQHLALRYPGQYEDPATGWFDNRYRNYDPAFGHYLEPDPMGPLPGQDPLGYAAAQPRRYTDPLGLLLFAFDGTLNQGSKTRSNVFRLQQRYVGGPVHYLGGPGTYDAVSAMVAPVLHGASRSQQSPYLLGPLGLVLRPVDMVTGDSVGDLVRTQMYNLLDTLLQNPPGLRESNGHIPIDIIGFSRGATAARIFANHLMKQTEDGLFRARVDRTDPFTHQPLGTPLTLTACLDFRFMGLFDTVAQLGMLGSNNAAYDYRVSPAWAWVAHAVALNEYNDLFPLTPLGISERGNFHETGFIGNHSDIGGSIQEADAGHVANASGKPGDLGNVALQWMYWQAQRAGVPMLALPSDALRIRNPLLHNSLLRYRYEDPSVTSLSLDRRVEGQADALLRQHELTTLGRQQRMQVEQFISRDLPSKKPLTAEDQFYGAFMVVPPGHERSLLGPSIVGLADVRAYARWLQETTGMKLQTGEVW